MLEGAQKMSRQSSNTYTFLSHKLFRYFLFLLLLYCFTLSPLYCDCFFFFLVFQLDLPSIFVWDYKRKKLEAWTHILYILHVYYVFYYARCLLVQSLASSHICLFIHYTAQLYIHICMYICIRKTVPVLFLTTLLFLSFSISLSLSFSLLSLPNPPSFSQ